jgi:hypothetical protein
MNSALSKITKVADPLTSGHRAADPVIGSAR